MFLVPLLLPPLPFLLLRTMSTHSSAPHRVAFYSPSSAAAEQRRHVPRCDRVIAYVGTDRSGWVCSRCNEAASWTRGKYQCVDGCQSFLCDRCIFEPNDTALHKVSTHPHPLRRMMPSVSWQCDGCQRSVGVQNKRSAGDLPRYHCAASGVGCEYDLCQACFEKARVRSASDALQESMGQRMRLEDAPAPARAPRAAATAAAAAAHLHVFTPAVGLTRGCAVCKRAPRVAHPDGWRSYGCNGCDSAVCNECLTRSSEAGGDPSKSVMLEHLHPHRIAYVPFTTCDWMCNTCLEPEVSGKGERWRCGLCDFDMCGVCKEQAMAPAAPAPFAAVAAAAAPMIIETTPPAAAPTPLPAPPLPSAATAAEPAPSCIICLDDEVPIEYFFSNCGHQCCCRECAMRLTHGTLNDAKPEKVLCPKCRRRGKAIRVFMV